MQEEDKSDEEIKDFQNRSHDAKDMVIFGSNREDIVKVDARSLVSKFRSKSDIYNYLSQRQQLFLPPFDEAKVGYLRDVLSKKKLVCKTKEITMPNIPRFPEISVKNLWPLVKDNPNVNCYFPLYSDNKYPSAKFFFGILSVVYPEFLSEAIDECLVKRHRVNEANKEDDYIEMTKPIYDAIMGDVWVSKSQGRGVYLLKKKAKTEYNKRTEKKASMSQAVKDLLKRK